MSTRKPKLARIALVGVFAMMSVAGCSETTASSQVIVPVDTELRAMLDATLIDEYRARAIYQRVMADFGEVMPFVNIEDAERRHAEAILGLFATRGWSAPDNPFDPQSVTSYASVAEACAAGVVAEIENADLYDGYLALALPFDVARVFGNNQRASLQNHLPAFEACDGVSAAP